MFKRPSRQNTASSTFSSSSQDSRPPHHRPRGFANPWPSAAPPSLGSIVSAGIPIRFAPKVDPYEPEVASGQERVRGIRVVRPDFDKDGDGSIVGTWLGHASFLIQFAKPAFSPDHEPIRFLFDPIFSYRAGPVRYIGPARRLPPPCNVEELPEIAFVCISHNHYDHLDLNSILELIKLQPKVRFLVPLGNKSWLESSGIPAKQISELDWWENVDLGPGIARDDPSAAILADEYQYAHNVEKFEPRVRITCVPAQHASGRSVTDQNSTLWCGWVVEQFFGRGESEKRDCVYFAGDTGYRSGLDATEVCPAFKEIGEKFRPIDLAMIPIWRGGTLSFVSAAGLELTTDALTLAHHATPLDALCIHLDLQARHSIAMHFATFVGSEVEGRRAIEGIHEAKANLVKARSQEGKKQERVG
ncbi:Metallo-hydrolase/oxidoreductase, partial [Gloeophyllum trabeum ATCC 11539]